MLPQEKALELLLARLPVTHSHRKFLEGEHHRTAAGTRGEARLQRRMAEFYLEEEFHLVWDIRLQIDVWKTQMDGLLLTQRGIVILESKNISGSIHFDHQTGEFLRINSEEEKQVMEDPQFQLNKHIRFLKQWLRMKKINLPVTGLIVFTSKECRFISKPANSPVCKTYQTHEYLLNALQKFPPVNTPVKLTKIKKLIRSNQIPYERSPMCRQYFIDVNDLKPGVYCHHCKTHTMARQNRNWICLKCGRKDPRAHQLSIQEYFTFIDTQLTNEKFRAFCQLDSRHVATRLLAEQALNKIGEKKSCVYSLKRRE